MSYNWQPITQRPIMQTRKIMDQFLRDVTQSHFAPLIENIKLKRWDTALSYTNELTEMMANTPYLSTVPDNESNCLWKKFLNLLEQLQLTLTEASELTQMIAKNREKITQELSDDPDLASETLRMMAQTHLEMLPKTQKLACSLFTKLCETKSEIQELMKQRSTNPLR